MIYEQLLVTPNVRFDVEVEINNSEDKVYTVRIYSVGRFEYHKECTTTKDKLEDTINQMRNDAIIWAEKPHIEPEPEDIEILKKMGFIEQRLWQ